jgi:hypothetical protein
MTIDINFVDSSKLEIVKLDHVMDWVKCSLVYWQ